jgi:hypothetical protein
MWSLLPRIVMTAPHDMYQVLIDLFESDLGKAWSWLYAVELSITADGHSFA